MTSTSIREDRWGFAEGDPITPDLTVAGHLGGGAAYEAFLAFDQITFGPVVVKVIRPDQVQDPHARDGLRREVRALETVRHPVVVRALREDLDGDRPHVVLESVDGPRLSTLIRRYGALQPAQYLPLAVDLCSALHYLRLIDHTHLDIKPSNLIMGSPARLIDLSLARTVAQAAALTTPVGTDATMAPEQCVPGGRYGVPGPASDVWGVGVVLHHAITGVPVFGEGDRTAPDGTPARHPQVAVPAPPLPERVPLPVRTAVQGMLEPRPADRPTPAEVSDLVSPVLAALPRGHLAGFRVPR